MYRSKIFLTSRKQEIYYLFVNIYFVYLTYVMIPVNSVRRGAGVDPAVKVDVSTLIYGLR